MLQEFYHTQKGVCVDTIAQGKYKQTKREVLGEETQGLIQRGIEE